MLFAATGTNEAVKQVHSFIRNHVVASIQFNDLCFCYLLDHKMHSTHEDQFEKLSQLFKAFELEYKQMKSLYTFIYTEHRQDQLNWSAERMKKKNTLWICMCVIF